MKGCKDCEKRDLIKKESSKYWSAFLRTLLITFLIAYPTIVLARNALEAGVVPTIDGLFLTVIWAFGLIAVMDKFMQ